MGDRMVHDEAWDETTEGLVSTPNSGDKSYSIEDYE